MARSEPFSERVLVHAPIGRDGPATAEVLVRVGVSAQVCMSLADLVAQLDLGAAAVFIAEEALFAHDPKDLFEHIAAQPAWSDLPFIVLTSRHEQPAVTLWRERMIEALGNVSLLERPIQALTLASAVRAAVRARRRQYEIRDLLKAREESAQQLEALVAARTEALESANTELRQQMEQRAKAEDALRQAQKIEAIGQLTGGIAHDFNNLLMVVSGGLDMIETNGLEPKRRRRLLAGMRQATQRGASLTRQLLAFSRRQPLIAEPVDLARQVGQMRDLLDRSLRGDIHVRLNFAPDLWPVEVDRGELELVILNLAVNARDALPHGGTILIKAENAPDTREGELKGDFVRLSVIDTGVGIPDEVKDRVFDPFFTTKEIGKGSGLGLAQVHGFATQSGGGVFINSTPGKGTNVTLLLPRASRTPSPLERAPKDVCAGEAIAGAAGHVLFVEDDDEVGALVTEMLVQLGYDVTRAESAGAALGALANGRDVDVVFSDIMMPGDMDGIDLAREVRKRRPGLPVLLTSGHAERVQEATQADGLQVLPKPYQLKDLGRALREAQDTLQSAPH